LLCDTSLTLVTCHAIWRTCISQCRTQTLTRHSREFRLKHWREVHVNTISQWQQTNDWPRKNFY